MCKQALCIALVIQVYSVSQCQAQPTDPSISNVVVRAISSPLGGEVFSAGSAIPITWDARAFPKDDRLRIDVWDISDGVWAVVLDDIPNAGAATIVLTPMQIARVRVVSNDSNTRLESAGFITVQQTAHRNPTGIQVATDASSSANSLVSVKQLPAILAKYVLHDATLAIYAYDGRLLHQSRQLSDIAKVLKSDATVLLYVNATGQPSRVALVVQP